MPQASLHYCTTDEVTTKHTITAVSQQQTLTLTLDLLNVCTLTFNPRLAQIMIYTNTQKLKFKGQSDQKTEWKQTDDGRMLPTALLSRLMWLVKMK